jgi:hypothetical protein
MQSSPLAIRLSRFKCVLTGFLTCFTLSLCTQAYAQDSALTLAQTFISKRDWAAAEAVLLPLSQSQPDNPFVSYEMAQIYENSDRADKAKQIYQHIIALPDTAQRQYTLIVRARNASHMTSLAALSQSKLNALNALTAETSLKSMPLSVVREVEVKPASAPSTPEAAQDNDGSADVISAMQKWARAWVNKDLDSYFSSYASNYKGNEASHSVWKRLRTTSISSKKSIAIELTEIQCIVISADKAQMSFQQTYTSNTFKDVTNKKLTWAKHGDLWLIEREAADMTSQN